MTNEQHYFRVVLLFRKEFSIMSFLGSVLFGFNGVENIFAKWIQTWALNFPMALCYQIFYVGPFVRLIFRTLFKKQLKD